jgi:hypothetical protein
MIKFKDILAENYNSTESYIKLAKLLNTFQPLMLMYDSPVLYIAPGNGLRSGSITQKFPGFGDSMDISNMVWYAIKDKSRSNPIIKQHTNNNYWIDDDNYIVSKKLSKMYKR